MTNVPEVPAQLPAEVVKVPSIGAPNKKLPTPGTCLTKESEPWMLVIPGVGESLVVIWRESFMPNCWPVMVPEVKQGVPVNVAVPV